MEEEMNFSDFLFDTAANLAVKAKEMLDQSENLTSQDLLNLSGVLLNVLEIMTGGQGDACPARGRAPWTPDRVGAGEGPGAPAATADPSGSTPVQRPPERLRSGGLHVAEPPRPYPPASVAFPVKPG